MLRENSVLYNPGKKETMDIITNVHATVKCVHMYILHTSCCGDDTLNVRAICGQLLT